MTLTCLKLMTFETMATSKECPGMHEKLTFAHSDSGGVVVVVAEDRNRYDI